MVLSLHNNSSGPATSVNTLSIIVLKTRVVHIEVKEWELVCICYIKF